MHRISLIKIVSLSLILVLLAGSFAVANDLADVKNQRIELIDEIKQTVDEKKQKEETIIEKENIVQQLETDIRNIKSINDELNGEYADLLVELEQLRDIIGNAQIYFEKASESAKTTVLYLYKNSKTTYEAIVKDSGNIFDLFKNVNYVRSITDKDTQVIIDAIKTLDELYVKESVLIDDIRSKSSQIRDMNDRFLALSVSRSNAQRDLRMTIDDIQMLLAKTSELEEYSLELIEEIKKLQKNTNEYVGGGMRWPVPSSRRVVSYFGYRIHPVYKDRRMHKGIDIAAPYNRNIVAANDGIVISSSYITGYGYTVIIDHGGGISTLYAHSNKLLVKAGDLVFKGDLIALIGSSGLSTGPHLHFEVRVNGVQKNPFNYLE